MDDADMDAMTADLSPLLASLEALEKRATAGPWSNRYMEGRVASIRTESDPQRRRIADLNACSPNGGLAHFWGYSREDSLNNADFIVALRNAWPQLSAFLRAAAEPAAYEQRMFPLQKSWNATVKTGPLSIPWVVAEKAYQEYARQYGTGQSMERMAERGGFGWCEMDSLYPPWREEVDKVKALERALQATAAELADLTNKYDAVRRSVADHQHKCAELERKNANQVTNYTNALALMGYVGNSHGVLLSEAIRELLAEVHSAHHDASVTTCACKWCEAHRTSRARAT